MQRPNRSVLIGLAVLTLSLSFIIADRGDANAVPTKDPVTGPVLRRGQGLLGLGGSPRVLIPADVVVTDVVIRQRYIETESCETRLYEVRADGGYSVYRFFHTTNQQAAAELHLQSGIAHEASTVQIGFQEINSCTLDVAWTGYTKG